MEATAPSKKKRRGGTRRKTGCFTCKSRHSRCDEKKPVCSNCERLNLECQPSDFIAPSAWTIVFNSAAQSQSQSNHDASPSTQSHAPASTWDIFRSHILGIDQISDDSIPTQTPVLVGLPTPAPTSACAWMLPAVSLTSETAFLLQTYRRTVATWMDVFDHNQTYELSIPRLTLTSPLLFHCICAFTARHLSLSQSGRNSSWTPIAQHHYGEALRLLISLLNSPSAQDHALTATILLSSYEVISSLGQEHRRHFLGAMMLIKSHGITARSIGIDRANFWIYVRHEIGVALATEKPLILNPDEWNVQWEEGETREDMLGNHILWILARAIGLVYGRSKEAKDIELEQRKRKELIDETYKWRHELPDTFVWVKYGEPDEEGFKRVYFAVSAAAAAMFWYHIVHILLLAEPTVQDQTHDSEIQYHAMQIANIAISDIPDSVRVFSSHGLYYAAKRIDGVARKARIWNLLHDIETQLGYHTRTAVKRLQGLVETGN